MSSRARQAAPRDVAPFDFDSLRRRFKRHLHRQQRLQPGTRHHPLAEGKADLFAFGRPFIANPDLVERMKTGAPLAALDPATLYGGGAAGYTDYPTLAIKRANT